MSAPIIRVALVGLSQSAKVSWASDAHLPYLLSPSAQSKYKLVALLNSSTSAAEAAKKLYNLPSDIKAYGNPQDLASDLDVDLVIVVTRVDTHYDVAVPSVKAGKDIWIEWPLAENISRAREILELARSKKVRTIVGLQGRVAPYVVRVKEVIESGRIGKVLSSNLQAYSDIWPRAGLPESLEYFTERRVGGNLVTVIVGHTIDLVHAVLGEYDSSNSHVQLQRPEVQIGKPVGGNFYEFDKSAGIKQVTSDVPDLVSIHGALKPSSHVAEGASLLFHYRSGPPFKGIPPFTWTINGEKGEIRISTPHGPFLHSEAGNGPVRVEVQSFDRDEVVDDKWEWEEWQEGLLARGRNTAKLYDAFYRGEGYPTFEDAVVRHEQLDRLIYG